MGVQFSFYFATWLPNLKCLDETKPKNMFAESVKIWVLKQISSITAHSDQSFNAQRKEKYWLILNYSPVYYKLFINDAILQMFTAPV